MTDTLEKYMVIWAVGGFDYGLIEQIWRGYTHWSMVIVGGICFLLLTLIARMEESRWKKWIMGAAVITTVEFVAGCLVNLRMGMEIWDYSDEAVHLMGQICPKFTVMWFILCIPIIPLAQWLYAALSGRMDA